jgi:C-terminal processing protease CtpA/Prc
LNWRSRDYIAAVPSWHQTPGWKRDTCGRQQLDSAMHYNSPVVVLTSGTTYSSAEQFVTGIRTMRRGTIVGEATGGSVSNPMVFQLPGGGMGFIASKDDYYPDGRLFNGVGIMPDVPVSPTIADIRAGRDRALEKAVEMLKVKHSVRLTAKRLRAAVGHCTAGRGRYWPAYRHSR